RPAHALDGAGKREERVGAVAVGGDRLEPLPGGAVAELAEPLDRVDARAPDLGGQNRADVDPVLDRRHGAIILSMATETMSKRERVRAALAGDEVDRVPISFWGHFEADPRTGEEVAAACLAFQRRFDWDFVKMMPSGMYFPQALGCEITPASGPGGVNGLATSVVNSAADWARLPELDPTKGWLAEHVESVRIARRELGPDVPIIQTLFSPLTVAHKLSLNGAFGRYVREETDALIKGLESITRSSIKFAQATLDAGADGFFYATQDATLDELTEPEFERLGKAYDLQVLKALDDRAWFNLFHVCRESIMADEVA